MHKKKIKSSRQRMANRNSIPRGHGGAAYHPASRAGSSTGSLMAKLIALFGGGFHA
jgi:hypothetical protein